ncbi:MAG TPA: nucleotidyltransferase family protein [Gaiellales bacterium]|nr:nucleotidyltransferase family protein [Gaiellales bacterium]
MRRGNLLLAALREPECLPALGGPDWTRLLQEGRAANTLARLEARLEERKLLEQIPARAREHLHGARLIVAQQQQLVRWEVARLQEALRPTGVRLVLLKGAAYVMSELPVARGRLFADVDLMVPRAKLIEVEERLLKAGWRFLELEPYDDRYYRQWSHELPPLVHHDREIVVDVHHTILPPTGRLHPDPERLLEAAVPIVGSELKVLDPADMVLHAAVHMFQDGELQGELRDLIDLDALMRHFGAEVEFWDRLVPRARQLGLERPLFYALRYATRLLGTPVPTAVDQAARAAAPPWPIVTLMDGLVTRSLAPGPPGHGLTTTRLSRALLYVRARWLRMPPRMLARHLAHKARQSGLRMRYREAR